MSSDTRNWLERLSQKIPGYSGYADRERRRDVDKLHREHLADTLRSLKAPLTELMGELTNSGRLFEVGPIDLAIKKLDRLENRVRFASYGYAGFFDLVKIEQPQLDAIYSFDLSLVEQVEKLEGLVRGLKQSAGAAETLRLAAHDLAAEIESVDGGFDQRYRSINEFGQGQSADQPPGRPLFS